MVPDPGKYKSDRGQVRSPLHFGPGLYVADVERVARLLRTRGAAVAWFLFIAARGPAS